ncbi:MAG: hypothetical protein LBC07_05250 [Elusimicrobiota bacterium]|jgi:hypothetical protein|nr:hypothetical protein [Elusimicrobiota bacterium]
MTNIRPKQFTRIGEFYLEEAVLDVLLEARCENGDACIGAAEISKRAGIYGDTGKVHMNDAIATGLLNKLCAAGKVERCSQRNKRGGWKITDKEFERRKD